MAKIAQDITVGLHIEYRIVFFPFATYARCGDTAALTVWGIPVYRRAGTTENILGFTRTRTHAS